MYHHQDVQSTSANFDSVVRVIHEISIIHALQLIVYALVYYQAAGAGAALARSRVHRALSQHPWHGPGQCPNNLPERYECDVYR